MISFHKHPARWLIYLCVLLDALWIAAEIHLRQTRRRLHNLWTYSIHIEAVKATSGENLSPWISHTYPDEKNLPFILAGDGDQFKREFTITSDKPVKFGVMAEGYR